MSDPLHKGSVRPRGHSGLSGEDLADSFGKAHPLQFLFDGKVLVFDLGNGRPLGLRAAHAYLIFVICFTQAIFLENKIYTEKRVNYDKRILQQNSVNCDL